VRGAPQVSCHRARWRRLQRGRDARDRIVRPMPCGSKSTPIRARNPDEMGTTKKHMPDFFVAFARILSRYFRCLFNDPKIVEMSGHGKAAAKDGDSGTTPATIPASLATPTAFRFSSSCHQSSGRATTRKCSGASAGGRQPATRRLSARLRS
jgi:hypothetical protein